MTDTITAKLNMLLDWANSNGAKIHPDVEFRNTPDRGIAGFKKADGELSGTRSDYQIQIPTSIIITPQASNSFFDEQFPSFSHELANDRKYSNSNAATKLFLSFSKFSSKSTASSEAAHFSPYVESLPIGDSTPDSPLLWSISDRKLLKGSNLGSSLEYKLIVLIKEWYEVINALSKSVAASAKPDQTLLSDIEKSVNFYKQYFFNKGEVLQLCYVNLEQFHSSLAALQSNESWKTLSWTSFEAYVWSHLMMTSRSFPYHVISPSSSCERRQSDEAILLPVIDLLNHKFNESVEWTSTAGPNNTKYFNFNNLSFNDSLAPGAELFNNYGGKNNEELWLGYGFLVAGSKYDTCALKLKLPSQHLYSLAEQYPDLKLPTPDDFSNLTVADPDDKFKDGLLYFLSNDNPVPQELLQIFALLVKNEYDDYFISENGGLSSKGRVPITSRMQLYAINNLQNAIEAKLAALDQHPVHVSSLSTQREVTAAQYKKSQEKLFHGSLEALKKVVKSTLKSAESQSKILTLKKILNKDEKFRDALVTAFNDPDGPEEDGIIAKLISPETALEQDLELIEQVLVLWLVRCSNKNFYPEYKLASAAFDLVLPSFIFDLFLWFKIHKFKTTEFHPEEISHYKTIHEAYFPLLAEKCPDIFGVGSWNSIDLVIAARILDLLRFSRTGKEEIYLLEDFFVD